jgi:hypothetical protein
MLLAEDWTTATQLILTGSGNTNLTNKAGSSHCAAPSTEGGEPATFCNDQAENLS